MADVTTKVLANVVRVEAVTEETVPESYRLTTATKAGMTPEISEGAKEVLRKANTLLAANKFEDLVTGYAVSLEDSALTPEVFALIDGGTLRYDDVETTKVVGYDAPVAGTAVSRTPFTLNVYTEEKDVDGETLGYAQFIFKHCKGKPASFELEDGQFMVPSMEIHSAPKVGESAVALDFLDELPV